MKMTDRWRTDGSDNFVRVLKPVEAVRTWEEARQHLLSVGITEKQIENQAAFPKRAVADFLAASQGFIYPNYRPL